MRIIGAGFAPSYRDDYFTEVTLAALFDIVACFDATTAARPLLRRFPDSW